MGVPKFFRWLSERYPLINQRYHVPSAENDEDTEESSSSAAALVARRLSEDRDVLKSATLPPQVDRLYIDMNGLLHGCSHKNNEDDSSVTDITHDQIFENLGLVGAV